MVLSEFVLSFLGSFLLFFPPLRFPDDNAKTDRSESFASHISWSNDEVYRFPTKYDPGGGGGEGKKTLLLLLFRFRTP